MRKSNVFISRVLIGFFSLFLGAVANVSFASEEVAMKDAKKEVVTSAKEKSSPSMKQDDGINLSVNINTASAEEISAMLSGVGEAKARNIVEYRDQHGKFVDLEALKKVKGIGQSIVDKNKDRIMF
ncbi:MAG: ComEA family DNA-binding protein [Vibrio sp.]